MSSDRPVYRYPREPLSLLAERQPASIVSANRSRAIAILVLAAAAVLPIAGCTAADEPEPEKAPFSVAATQQQEQTVRDGIGSADGDQSALTIQLRTFDELVDALREHYVFSEHHAVPWDDLESRYRTKVLSLLRSSEFPDVVREMMAELPPHAAVWQSRDERIDRQSTDSRNYEGIGAYVAFRGEPLPRVILLSVMPGSPAERAGLRDHDALLAVDGIPVSVDEGDEVVNRIRGPAGSVVNLTVRTPNAAPRIVPVTRGRVQLTEGANRVRYALLPETDVAYILLPRQSTTTLGAEIARALTVMSAEVALRGVILDLRVAALGNSWPLDEMLTMFGNGTLGEMYSVGETIPLVIAGQDVAGSQTLPLALLVGRDTEGLPEIFAGALQSVGRAVVFGTRTSGAIEASQLVPLSDGSRVLISSTSYRTATGLDVGLAGLEPNLSVSFDWDAVTEQVDPVRNASQMSLAGAGG